MNDSQWDEEIEAIRHDENLTLAQKNKAIHEIEMEQTFERRGDNLNG